MLILNFQVRAVAVSSTEVRLSWKAPKADEQNGDLLGYKIFYYATHINGQAGLEETEVIVRHPDYNIALRWKISYLLDINRLYCVL